MTKSLPLAIVISTHLIRRLVCQGPNMPLKGGLRAPWGILKCEFLKSEGLLVCYISKLIPVVGKLNEKHLTIRLVCWGPPGPLTVLFACYIRIDLKHITVLRLLSKLH